MQRSMNWSIVKSSSWRTCNGCQIWTTTQNISLQRTELEEEIVRFYLCNLKLNNRKFARGRLHQMPDKLRCTKREGIHVFWSNSIHLQIMSIILMKLWVLGKRQLLWQHLQNITFQTLSALHNAAHSASASPGAWKFAQDY